MLFVTFIHIYQYQELASSFWVKPEPHQVVEPENGMLPKPTLYILNLYLVSV